MNTILRKERLFSSIMVIFLFIVTKFVFCITDSNLLKDLVLLVTMTVAQYFFLVEVKAKRSIFTYIFTVVSMYYLLRMNQRFVSVDINAGLTIFCIFFCTLFIFEAIIRNKVSASLIMFLIMSALLAYCRITNNSFIGNVLYNVRLDAIGLVLFIILLQVVGNKINELKEKEDEE